MPGIEIEFANLVKFIEPELVAGRLFNALEERGMKRTKANAEWVWLQVLEEGLDKLLLTAVEAGEDLGFVERQNG